LAASSFSLRTVSARSSASFNQVVGVLFGFFNAFFSVFGKKEFSGYNACTQGYYSYNKREYVGVH
jgi:hypothetical protein